jgi:hypothetical protein
VRTAFKKASLSTPTATGIGSTEGADQVTLQLTPTDLGAGLYNVSVVMVQRTASNAATSDVLKPVLTYTNEVGTRTQVSFTVPTATTFDHKASAPGAEQAWTTLIRAASGPIVIAVSDTVTGAKSAGVIDWYVVIEKVGSDA